MERQVASCLQLLSEDVSDLCLPAGGRIAELDRVPTALEFLRDWYTPNRPFIVRGAASQWPACSRWCPQFFREHYGKKTVTVAVTPSGYADAITTDRVFALPEEREMSFSDFLDIMDDPSKYNGVFYIQKQNSNLSEDLAELLEDVPTEIGWMSEALNRPPDATNFWMGDARAVTSLHKDHYENLYCVISGHKDFCLLPPTDRPFIPYRNFPTARYRETDGVFRLDPPSEPGSVPWADLDPLDPPPTPLHRLQLRLTAGDMLYLPSLWFHHVRQSHACVAVNYWYDMEYDLRYCYFKLLENMADRVVQR